MTISADKLEKILQTIKRIENDKNQLLDRRALSKYNSGHSSIMKVIKAAEDHSKETY